MRFALEEDGIAFFDVAGALIMPHARNPEDQRLFEQIVIASILREFDAIRHLHATASRQDLELRIAGAHTPRLQNSFKIRASR